MAAFSSLQPSSTACCSSPTPPAISPPSAHEANTAAAGAGVGHHAGVVQVRRRFAWLLLGLTAAALLGVVTAGVMSMAANAGSGAVTPVLDSIPLLHAPMLAAALAPSGDGLNNAAELLARPLFSASRRPPASIVGASETLIRPMPRLTGVVVSPVGRYALFANAEGGRPLVMREGDHLGANVIEAIAAGQVTVRGPGGQAVLRSTFDESAAPTKPATAVAPELPIARKLPMPFRASPRRANPTRP